MAFKRQGSPRLRLPIPNSTGCETSLYRKAFHWLRYGLPSVTVTVALIPVKALQRMVLGGRHALAAAIAYYGLLSFFPLILLLLSVLGFVFPATALADQLTRLSDELLPGSGSFFEQSLAQLVAHRGSLGLTALVTLYWSASGAFTALSGALDQVWGVPGAPGETGRPGSAGSAGGSGGPPHGMAAQGRFAGIGRRLRALALVLSLVALFAVSIVATTYLRLAEWLRDLPSVGPLGPETASGLLSVVPVLVTAIVFLAVYAFIPTRRPPWRALWPGTLVATVLFELAKGGFAWYAARVRLYAWVYGSVTTAIVLLLWFYIVATVLIYGAEVGYVAGTGGVKDLLHAVGEEGGEGAG